MFLKSKKVFLYTAFIIRLKLMLDKKKRSKFSKVELLSRGISSKKYLKSKKRILVCLIK